MAAFPVEVSSTSRSQIEDNKVDLLMKTVNTVESVCVHCAWNRNIIAT